MSQIGGHSLVDTPARREDDEIRGGFLRQESEAAMRRGFCFKAATSALVLGLGMMANSLPADAAPNAQEEAAYTQTITERAEKIVAPLGIDDASQATRIRDLVVKQYRSLREIHAARDAKLAEAQSPGDPAVAEAWRSVARKDADLKIFPLHRQFVARLEAELTPEQVNQVKDGMTYGVVPLTFKRYRELLPQLTVEQQAEILANLLEAREYAIDAGSSEEKHAWFGKYKGRINNLLSAAGYDMKQAEKDLAEREKAAASAQ
jgi:hypothetical protein